ncbi:hypothetical protein [Tateyamaria sp.]|uniref:hypothetical protein n=1 Tax=Tateyamaria sp. TaxID=1929288 RepID=UPI00329AF943
MFDTGYSKDVIALAARAEQAAGRPDALRRRARAYLELYQDSNQICVFALVAAHGAIWASWYLVCAKLAAMVFAVLDPTGPYRPVHRYRCFATYVAALKEINRTVMVATYVIVHGIRELGPDALIADGFPPDLVNDYDQLMTAPDTDQKMLRDLYHRHFLWEQDRVVSDILDTAFAQFDWPFMAQLCQRPWVWFSYFRVGKSMNFRRFTDKEERIEKGLIAYDQGAAQGFDRLADVTLRTIVLLNRILPKR